MWKTLSEGQSIVEEAIKHLLPPCQIQCPINEDIQRTNVLLSLLPTDPDAATEGLIQIGDYLYQTNPLFSICGYVCGLCELACNYQSKGGAVKRRLLKRFVADGYMDHLEDKAEFDLVKTKENVAVVGGGPAGLMAAYDLSKRGYKVTLFEASDRLGGSLWLIPNYRLPKDMLLKTVNHLVRIAGIDVRYNVAIGRNKTSLDKLKKDGFQAVFVAKGTPLPRVLTFQGEILPHQDLSGVMFGLDFLYELSHGNLSPDYFSDKKVLVIGGGNVAFDVARSACRMGGATTVIALENEDKASKDGIPADEAEITGAWEEGIRLIYSRGVSQIIGSSGKFKGIESPKCISVFDQGNGFNPQFDLTDTITIDGDVIIITVGQGPDSSFFKSEDLVDENGRLAINPVSLQNGNKDWVFIGGDNRRPGYMADAMRDGLEAAESIERYFLGSDIERGRVKYYEPLLTPQRRHYQESPETVWIQPEKRMHFKVFEQGFKLEEAIEEAKRCLKCGPCAACKACVSIGLQSHLPYIEVDKNMCCGCGICVTACGFGAIYLTDQSGVLSSQTDILKCKTCGMCMSACPSNARLLIGSGINRRVDEVIAQL